MKAKTYWVQASLAGLVGLLSVAMAWSQATTSLRGTVLDPSGAVIPAAKVAIVNAGTGLSRATTTGAEGNYEFSQVLPGTYRLEVEASGFRKYVGADVKLLVNTPAMVNVTLEVGAQTQVVAVTAEAPVLNTADASMGIAFAENQVKQLPLEARNVVDLLSLQPGVVYTGNRPDIDLNTDTRSGAVNGARSDQSNVTLDGVDVNDQGNGYAFTSVLRMTLDAVQEFRVTTTNYNADQGRSSGAQVSLVTKAGSNTLHGSLYEYHRNTATSANDYFIKGAQLRSGEKNQAPKLIRNIFGGSLGGPIKKDRAFFFANFEGRRDRQEESVVRVVPTSTLRQGEVRYPDVDGNTVTLTSQDLKNMDPLGIGPNPVVMSLFQTYPLPNDTSVGDGLNYSGYRFPAPVQRNFYTYIGRLDYKLTASGNQNLFWRGNLQNDADRGVPFLPGRSPLQINEDFSKGFVLGHTAILRPNLVNNFRWGFTRQSEAVLGNSTQPWVFFRGIEVGVTRTRRFTFPVHNFVDDFSWVKGKHSFSFGTNIRFIRNPRFSLQNSFSDGITNGSWLTTAAIANTGIPLDPAVSGFPAVASEFSNSYDFPLIALMGIVTEVDATYNYDRNGNLLAQGTPTSRHFGTNEYEFYFQDSWRIKPNFTVTFGLRYALLSPPWETTGLQVGPPFDMGQWFEQRGTNMRKGIPSNQDPMITFDLAGSANSRRGYYDWDKKNFAPHLAFAYSPRPHSNFFKRIFGEADKTSIRAGFGMVYDRIGAGLLSSFDRFGSFGLSTGLTNPAAIQTVDCAPRITNMNVIPTQDCTGANIFIPAPPGAFPQTPPSTLDSGGFAIAWGLDNSIKTPYSYMLDASIARELPKNFSFEAAYVAHLAHRLLIQEDLAMPLDLYDPKTGIDYFSAATRLSQLGAAGRDTSEITPALVGSTAAYWDFLFGPTPVAGFDSNVQAAYSILSDPANGFLYNETTGLFVIDLFGYPGEPVGGLNSFFNKQYSSLYAWRSKGNSNYHALQLSLRKRLSHGVQFDFNYTWSKSIDLMSDAERIGPWGGLGGQVINSWSRKQLRAVSDFDAAQQFNTNWIWELPFGQGHWLGHDAHGVAEALIGGWQVAGLLRWTTGFPVNVFNGYLWPTNWQLGGQAMLKGPAPQTRTTKNGDGTVNMFPDPEGALKAYRHPYPGESGNRNAIRGDGFYGFDLGLSKRWKMPYAESHSLQFRWETFNVTNSVRFNVQSNPPELDQVSAFGKYTGLVTNPRVMQFALRYEF